MIKVEFGEVREGSKIQGSESPGDIGIRQVYLQDCIVSVVTSNGIPIAKVAKVCERP